MDVNRFFNYGGDYIKNPNYKKGNGQPKYITSVDANPKVVSGVLTNTADLPTVFNPDKASDRLARGMLEHNLPLRREDYINKSKKEAGNMKILSLFDGICGYNQSYQNNGYNQGGYNNG